jgi:S-DNA-T family DNA segregation ATPase FtsK/SpoIIIE
MLFLSPGTSQLLRGQGTFLSDDEITRITEFVATDSPQFARELIELKTKDDEQTAQPGAGGLKSRDELYEAAVDVVVRERRGSVSLLQRCLGIGYGRAARLIDFMAEDGIVGEYNGAQAREVLISVADWEAMSAGEDAGEKPQAAAAQPLTAATVQPRPKRTNRIVPQTDEPSDLEDDEAADELEDDDYDGDEELDSSDRDGSEEDDQFDDDADEQDESEEDSELWDESDDDGSDWADKDGDDADGPGHGKRAASA